MEAFKFVKFKMLTRIVSSSLTTTQNLPIIYPCTLFFSKNRFVAVLDRYHQTNNALASTIQKQPLLKQYSNILRRLDLGLYIRKYGRSERSNPTSSAYQGCPHCCLGLSELPLAEVVEMIRPLASLEMNLVTLVLEFNFHQCEKMKKAATATPLLDHDSIDELVTAIHALGPPRQIILPASGMARLLTDKELAKMPAPIEKCMTPRLFSEATTFGAELRTIASRIAEDGHYSLNHAGRYSELLGWYCYALYLTPADNDEARGRTADEQIVEVEYIKGW